MEKLYSVEEIEKELDFYFPDNSNRKHIVIFDLSKDSGIIVSRTGSNEFHLYFCIGKESISGKTCESKKELLEELKYIDENLKG